jgi:hypothetical protein
MAGTVVTILLSAVVSASMVGFVHTGFGAGAAAPYLKSLARDVLGSDPIHLGDTDWKMQ